MEHPFVTYIKSKIARLNQEVRLARAMDYRNSNPVARGKIRRLRTALREFERFQEQETL